MTTLSHAQEQTRQRIQQLAGLDLTPVKLGARILEAVELAVPSDGYRLFGLDPTTLLINRLLAARDEAAHSPIRWLRHIYLATDELVWGQFPTLMHARIPVVAFHDRPTRSWGFPDWIEEQVDADNWFHAYHAWGTPEGGVIFASFRAHGHWVASLGLNRYKLGHDYLPNEVAFLRLLGPSIGQAIDAALTRERARQIVPNERLVSSSHTGILAIGDDGHVRLSTPEGERWSDILLQDEFGLGERLPAIVWSLAAAMRHQEQPNGLSIVVPTHVGPVRLEATRAVADDATAIVFAPVLPPAPPEIPASWPLTGAERQVVSLLLHGLGNRQIADQLFLSENTIQTHLRHAYEKLDVHTRTQLLARLFDASYLPALIKED